MSKILQKGKNAWCKVHRTPLEYSQYRGGCVFLQYFIHMEPTRVSILELYCEQLVYTYRLIHIEECLVYRKGFISREYSQ